MAVGVFDKHGKPLMPCSEKRARLMLKRGRARVHRLVPFIIRLVDRDIANSNVQPIQIKIDPGSRTTGIAVVRTVNTNAMQGPSLVVVSLIHLLHRANAISDALTQRRAFRKNRRSRLRYRQRRYFNRKNQKKGWLPPSRQHLVNTIMAWVQRLLKWFPITSLATELVRFDMAKMQALDGHTSPRVNYDVREYLLEKWNHACAYCDIKHVPLNIEHIQPKARGGSDRLSNLAIACVPCNQRKAARTIEDFLVKDPLRLATIKSQLRRPLKDAAAVNATRSALFRCLQATGLPVETGTGAQTKYNRTRLGLPKDHALDAVCVGHVNEVSGWHRPFMAVCAMGRGAYRRTRLDKFGFPRGYLMRTKQVHGFQTGDRVKVVMIKGAKKGTYVGRVAVRATGKFNIQSKTGLLQGIWYKRCTIVQRNDGYRYDLYPKITII